MRRVALALGLFAALGLSPASAQMSAASTTNPFLGKPASKFQTYQVSLPGSTTTVGLAAETTAIRLTVAIRCDGTSPVAIDWTGINTNLSSTSQASAVFNTSFQPVLFEQQPVSNGQITLYSTASNATSPQTCTITVGYL